MTEPWLSVSEIARHLGVSRDTIYKLISRKQLPGHKIGKLWKFRAAEVDDWVKSGRMTDHAEVMDDRVSQPDQGGAA